MEKPEYPTFLIPSAVDLKGEHPRFRLPLIRVKFLMLMNEMTGWWQMSQESGISMSSLLGAAIRRQLMFIRIQQAGGKVLIKEPDGSVKEIVFRLPQKPQLTVVGEEPKVNKKPSSMVEFPTKTFKIIKTDS